MNKFELLPEADQQFILGLCEKHIYAEAVKIIAQPRPVGLSIVASISTLCRFNTRHSRDCTRPRCSVNTPNLSASGARPRMGHKSPQSLPQSRTILACLKNGAALKDLADEFRILGSAFRCFNTQEQWRREQEVPKHHYHKHVNNSAAIIDFESDFIATDQLRSQSNPDFENPDYAFSAEDNDEIQACALPLPTREDPNPFARLLAKNKACLTRKADQIPSYPAAPEQQSPPNGAPGIPLIESESSPQNSMEQSPHRE